MKPIQAVTFLMGVCLIGFSYVAPAQAFLGEYNSATGNDAAFMASFRNADADYEDSDDDELDVERKSLILGASKTIDSKIKAFGGLSWGLDGKIDDSGFDLDHGYTLIGGGSYMFYDQSVYTVSGYGELNYIFEEEYQNSDTDVDITLDGYELLIGVIGKYNVNMNLSAYGALQIMMISDVTGEASGPGVSNEEDFERDDMFGMKFGAIYDEMGWFVKGGFELGFSSGFIITGGMKF